MGKARGKETTEEERKEIIRLRKAGESIATIVTKIGRTKNTIIKIICEYKEKGTVQRKSKRLLNKDKVFINDYIKKYPNTLAREIKNALKEHGGTSVEDTTIKRYLYSIG